MNNTSNKTDENIHTVPPGCTNPNQYETTTAFLDSAASLTLLGMKAVCKVAAVQERNKTLGTPKPGQTIQTVRTIELLLPKWPQKARRGFQVPNITNNLVSVAELADAQCGVYFHEHGVEIEYEGEIIGRGWRDQKTRLWRVPLTSEGGHRIMPDTPPDEYDPKDGLIFNASVNSIYECENKEQLIQYYHASLGSHPKNTLIAAADAGYLRGCPGLDSTSIRKHIGIEVATEMGHMKQVQKGVRSTRTNSKRGRPKLHAEIERVEAAADAMAIPSQEPSNADTHVVFMTTQCTDGYIASDQTGMFPRISSKGMKYVCIFFSL